jgi:hypothetical protein
MLEPYRSDRSLEELVKTRDLISTCRRQDPESGQATTEFALILLPLLLLVAGIIQFGIGLNYWLDMHRLANQGARWAVVNAYPGCPRTGLPATPCNPTLQNHLACEPVALALQPTVTVSFPNGPEIGDPVKVELSSQFNFVPIIGVRSITLRAHATMRLEQDATRVLAGANTPGPCP